jgi:hypothetical protein
MPLCAWWHTKDLKNHAKKKEKKAQMKSACPEIRRESSDLFLISAPEQQILNRQMTMTLLSPKCIHFTRGNGRDPPSEGPQCDTDPTLEPWWRWRQPPLFAEWTSYSWTGNGVLLWLSPAPIPSPGGSGWPRPAGTHLSECSFWHGVPCTPVLFLRYLQEPPVPRILEICKTPLTWTSSGN